MLKDQFEWEFEIRSIAVCEIGESEFELYLNNGGIQFYSQQERNEGKAINIIQLSATLWKRNNKMGKNAILVIL